MHEVLEQDFLYTTKWATGSAAWTQKITTVTTTDLTRSGSGNQYKTVYTYDYASADVQPGVHQSSPAQIPVEAQIQYYDTTGALLETVTKTWANERTITQQQTTLANGQTSETDWQYYPTTSFYSSSTLAGVNYEPTTEIEQYRYDYDYGSGGRGSLLRETYLPSYDNSFALARNILDKPNSVEVLDGGGNLKAARSYSYDGSGNLLSRSDWLNSSGSQVLKTTHTYDSYGNILSTTDPDNNTTNYGYADNFADTCSYTPAPGAYLTSITYPPTAGAPDPDQEAFQYYCTTGELASSTDENGNKTSYEYNDSLNRRTETDYPTGWGKQTIAYSDGPGAISIETKRLDSSGSTWSDAMDLFDGMSHELSQSQANGQSTSWSRSDTCYDGSARASASVYPYLTSNDTTQPNCSSLVWAIPLCMTR